ncbi:MULTISPECIES: hypothetical protein [Methanosarcina]|uniref:Uncharacterized protein n=1 Tax=Methanosarcina barkeri MS TaxID=1434108 RepID=A0A0E3LP71_METBA|nr:MULTISPECIES: hypothetical protein [Methanosarcina]AKB56011.1 hypothetical protein MSBRM_3013 [Methanosarcina barkeri MS]
MPNKKVIEHIGIHSTNTTDKTFICPNRCGISVCGDASIFGMPITSYIQSFIREKINTKKKVDEIPDMLIKYFRSFDPIPDATFLVAGYNKIEGTFKQSLYNVRIIDSIKEKIDTNTQGASWAGEALVLSRLLQPVSLKNNDGSYTDLPAQTILWNFFTLQDAIDFAKYAVETTINTMRFQNVVETVGNPIDILVIQPEKDPFWISKKGLGIGV